MVKHTKGSGKRRFQRYIRGSVDEQLDLGTLAAKTLVGTAFDNTVAERTYVSSIVASWSLQGFTQASDDGPILVGVAHSDYTDAEIEEVIENTGSWDEGDLISQEKNARKVRKVGILGQGEGVDEAFRLANGRKIKTKLGWILNAGDTLRLWAYNLGASALATTDPEVQVEGHANLWPK